MDAQYLKKKMMENNCPLRHPHGHHEHSQPCACPYSMEMQQKLLLKERAFKMMQMQNLYLQNMLNLERAKQQQNLWNHNLPTSFPTLDIPLTLPFNVANNFYGKIKPNFENELCEISEFEFGRSPPISFPQETQIKIEISDTTKLEHSDETGSDPTPKAEFCPQPLKVEHIKVESAIHNQNLSKQLVLPPSAAPSKPLTVDKNLRSKFETIIRFLLQNMGKSDQTTIDQARNLYTNQPFLLQVYNNLVVKYCSAKKSKEDIKRYILRKAFKVIRTPLINGQKVNDRQASIILCKRYFEASFSRLEKAGVNVNNEDELLDFFMPYNKQSRDRAIKTSFVLEIFSSDDFCQEYQRFLIGLGDSIAQDNERKMNKLIFLLMQCAKKNCLSKLDKFKRLPWLEVWAEDTKNIAIELMPNKKRIENFKKIKS